MWEWIAGLALVGLMILVIFAAIEDGENCEENGGKMHTTTSYSTGYNSSGQYGSWQTSTTQCLRPDGSVIP